MALVLLTLSLIVSLIVTAVRPTGEYGEMKPWKVDGEYITITVVDRASDEWDYAIRRSLGQWQRAFPTVRYNIIEEEPSTECPGIIGIVIVCSKNRKGPVLGETLQWHDNTHAYAATVVFTNQRTSEKDPDRLNTACHEFGHVLGLVHNNKQESCLGPTLLTRPGKYDILSLRRMYEESE